MPQQLRAWAPSLPAPRLWRRRAGQRGPGGPGSLPELRPPPFPRPRSDGKALGRCGGGVRPAGRRLTPERVVPARAGGGRERWLFYGRCGSVGLAGNSKALGSPDQRPALGGTETESCPASPRRTALIGPLRRLFRAFAYGADLWNQWVPPLWEAEARPCSAGGTRAANAASPGPGWSGGCCPSRGRGSGGCSEPGPRGCREGWSGPARRARLGTLQQHMAVLRRGTQRCPAGWC